MDIREAVQYLQGLGVVVKENALRQAVYRGSLTATNSNPQNPNRGSLLFTEQALEEWVKTSYRQKGNPTGFNSMARAARWSKPDGASE